jgi:hypothetical protein
MGMGCQELSEPGMLRPPGDLGRISLQYPNTSLNRPSRQEFVLVLFKPQIVLDAFET